MSKEEKERYNKFNPSIFQRVFWFFWPTTTYLRWKESKED